MKPTPGIGTDAATRGHGSLAAGKERCDVDELNRYGEGIWRLKARRHNRANTRSSGTVQPTGHLQPVVKGMVWDAENKQVEYYKTVLSEKKPVPQWTPIFFFGSRIGLLFAVALEIQLDMHLSRQGK